MNGRGVSTLANGMCHMIFFKLSAGLNSHTCTLPYRRQV